MDTFLGRTGYKRQGVGNKHGISGPTRRTEVDHLRPAGPFCVGVRRSPAPLR
jgi:hypothetical protein